MSRRHHHEHGKETTVRRLKEEFHVGESTLQVKIVTPAEPADIG